jgi:hypothetical protein
MYAVLATALVLAAAFVATAGQAQSAVHNLGKPSASSLVEPVVCIGNRRNYRNFNHCWRVNGHKGSVWPGRYCARICS